jgi:hypothetical protein
LFDLFKQPADYTYYYSTIPLATIMRFASQSTPPQPATFFTQVRTPICYGMSATRESVGDVVKQQDLCQAKFEAAGCAPGWSAGRLSSYICGMWRDCVATEETNDDDLQENEQKLWPAFGAQRLANPDLGLDLGWGFPAGWNDLPGLKSYWKSQVMSEVWHQMQGLEHPRTYAMVNVIFLVLAVVGWVSVIIGVVVSCCKGNDEVGKF